MAHDPTEGLRANRRLRYAPSPIRLVKSVQQQDMEICNPCPPTFLLPISPAGHRRLYCPLLIANASYAQNVHSAAKSTQIPTITAAAIRLTGSPPVAASCALARHSARTSGGMSFIATTIPRGIRTRSSRYPNTGTKSGIRSIGLNAYATTQATSNFAYHGV